MPYTQWFTGVTVARVLKGLQVWPVAGALSPDGTDLATLFQEQCDIAAAAIVDDIEMKTGRKPFLITRGVIPHSQTEYGGRLMLKVPARTIYSVSIGGNVIDASTYWTEPSEAAITGQPTESIQFASNYGNGFNFIYPNRILVDADFGSYAAVPPILYQAGLNMAALFSIATIQGEQDLASISEEGFSVGSDVVGPIDDKVRKDFWPEQYKRAWQSFVRVVV